MTEELTAVEPQALNQERTVETITLEIITLKQQFEQTTFWYALETGRRLVEAKSKIPHGAWGEYIKTKLNYSHSTVNNLMRIFNECSHLQLTLFGPEANSQALANLSYSKVLAILVLPDEEREEFVETHDVESMSERELKQALKERDEARREAETAGAKLADMERLTQEAAEARQDQEAAEEELKRMWEELEALRARPIEVQGTAVPDESLLASVREEAAQAARREAEEKLQKKVERAEKARDKAAADLKAAEEAKTAAIQAAEKAGEAAVQTAQEQTKQAEAGKKEAEARAAALEKELSVAGSKEVAEYGYCFKEVQERLNRLLGILQTLQEKGDTANHNRLAAAFRALVKSMGQAAPGDMGEHGE